MTLDCRCVRYGYSDHFGYERKYLLQQMPPGLICPGCSGGERKLFLRNYFWSTYLLHMYVCIHMRMSPNRQLFECNCGTEDLSAVRLNSKHSLSCCHCFVVAIFVVEKVGNAYTL